MKTRNYYDLNYGFHPFNLFFRFLLELTTFCALGAYGYAKFNGALKYVMLLLFPLFFALIWGVFTTPHDRSRSGKSVVNTPGWIRLIIEFIVFGFGISAFWLTHLRDYGLILICLVFLHYLFSYDRISWLLQQK